MSSATVIQIIYFVISPIKSPKIWHLAGPNRHSPARNILSIQPIINSSSPWLWIQPDYLEEDFHSRNSENSMCFLEVLTLWVMGVDWLHQLFGKQVPVVSVLIFVTQKPNDNFYRHLLQILSCTSSWCNQPPPSLELNFDSIADRVNESLLN